LCVDFHIDFAYWHSGAVSHFRVSEYHFRVSLLAQSMHPNSQGTNITLPTCTRTHPHTARIHTHTHTHTHTHSQMRSQHCGLSSILSFKGSAKPPFVPPTFPPSLTRHLPLPLALSSITTVSSCAHALHSFLSYATQQTHNTPHTLKQAKAVTFPAGSGEALACASIDLAAIEAHIASLRAQVVLTAVSPAFTTNLVPFFSLSYFFF